MRSGEAQAFCFLLFKLFFFKKKKNEKNADHDHYRRSACRKTLRNRGLCCFPTAVVVPGDQQVVVVGLLLQVDDRPPLVQHVRLGADVLLAGVRLEDDSVDREDHEDEKQLQVVAPDDLAVDAPAVELGVAEAQAEGPAHLDQRVDPPVDFAVTDVPRAHLVHRLEVRVREDRLVHLLVLPDVANVAREVLEEAREAVSLGDQPQLAQALEKGVVQAEPVARDALHLELLEQLGRAADVNHLPAAAALLIEFVLGQGRGHGSLPLRLLLLHALLALALLFFVQADGLGPGLLGVCLQRLLVLLAVLSERGSDSLFQLSLFFLLRLVPNLALLVVFDVLPDRFGARPLGLPARDLVHRVLDPGLVQGLLKARVEELPTPQHRGPLLIHHHVRAVVLEDHARLPGRG
mmetsp:Transcript_32816/g.61015  ORF Transcript_32816/g.61015 Transcript_32816/m.61015 type:complete len:405 (-) Transcript_32816:560-1774(-)